MSWNGETVKTSLKLMANYMLNTYDLLKYK